jgi:5-methylcytosine-specific restriction endonuclease McrA
VVTCAILPHHPGYDRLIPWSDGRVRCFAADPDVPTPTRDTPHHGRRTHTDARDNPDVPTRRPTRAVRYARRRRKRIAAKVHDLTESQWDALKVAWGGCAYCGARGTPLQKDCVLPISRGGRYVMANVVPCCRSCNTSKCNTEVTSWMRRKKLDERKFLLRQAEINLTLATDAVIAEPS